MKVWEKVFSMWNDRYWTEGILVSYLLALALQIILGNVAGLFLLIEVPRLLILRLGNRKRILMGGNFAHCGGWTEVLKYAACCTRRLVRERWENSR